MTQPNFDELLKKLDEAHQKQLKQFQTNQSAITEAIQKSTSLTEDQFKGIASLTEQLNNAASEIEALEKSAGLENDKVLDKYQKALSDFKLGTVDNLEQEVKKLQSERKNNVNNPDLEKKIREAQQKFSKAQGDYVLKQFQAKAYIQEMQKTDNQGMSLETKQKLAEGSAEMVGQSIESMKENPGILDALSNSFTPAMIAMLNTSQFKSMGFDIKTGGVFEFMKSLAANFSSAAAGPLMSNFKNTANVLAGFATQLEGFIGLFMGIGKSLVAIPLRIIEFAADQGKKVLEEQRDLMNQLEELQEKFDLRSRAGEDFARVQKTLMSRRTLDPNSRLSQLFGGATDTKLVEAQIKSISELVSDMGPVGQMMAKSVQSNVMEANDSISNYYYKAKKLMNMSSDDIQNLTTMSIARGKSFFEMFDDLSQATKKTAERFGLDFKMMSKDILVLRKDITNFAHKSNEELALVVARTQQLGVSLQDAMSVFNKFNTFEDAATTAAQLSQSFGMVLDSVKLLKAQSPDEILQQYKDAFQASGKSFETMDRFSRSLILQQTGLSEQAAQMLFSAENAGKSYEEIMQEVESKDPTKQQAKNIEDMKDAIVELKSVLQEEFKGFFGAITEGFTKAIAKNEKLRGAYAKITTALNNIFLKFTNMNLSSLSGVFDKIANKIQVIGNYISGKEFMGRIHKIVNSVFQIIDGFMGGSQVMSEQIRKAFKTIREEAAPIFSFFAGFGAEMLKQVGLFAVDALPILVDVINDFLDDLADAFNPSNKNNIFKKANKLFEGSDGIFDKIKTKLTETFDKILGTDGKEGMVQKIQKLLSGETGLAATIKKELFGVFDKDTSFESIAGDFIGRIVSNAFNSDAVQSVLDKEKMKIADNSWLISESNLGLDRAQIAAREKRMAEKQSTIGTYAATQSFKDGIIDMNGVRTKIDDKDSILAAKEGGPVLESLRDVIMSNQKNRIDMNEIRRAVQEGIMNGMKNVMSEKGHDQPIVISLNGEKVGQGLLRSGFTTMMTNPNITQQHPTVISESLNTTDGQSYKNRISK